jgi:hypothetical protein
VLLSSNSSIDCSFAAFDSNFNYVKAQISVLVPLHTLTAFLIFFFRIWSEKLSTVLSWCYYGCISFVTKCCNRVVHKLSCVLKRCCTGKCACLCELIQCAGEGSVGLYWQISIVKQPQPLIDFNHISDGSNSTIVRVRKCSGFICDAVDLFDSVFSFHTLVIVTIYCLRLIYDV